MLDIKRREFIALVGGGGLLLTAKARPARAQQPAMPVIGFLNSQSPGVYPPMAAAFQQGLEEIGFVEGQNVASLDRPGGNVTGVTNLSVELVQKQVEMLHELVPTATVTAALLNPTFPGSESQSRDLQAAARKLGLQLHVVHASTDRDFDPMFATMVQLRAGMLVIGADPYFFGHRDQIAALAIRHRMPAIFFLREFATVGGLISYGPIVTESYRQVGIYAGRTLKGEKSADLPVIQSTKFQLVINLRTAKALGLEVPPALLVRADEVIE